MAMTAEQHHREAVKHGVFAGILWGALVVELVAEGAVDLATAVIVPLLGIEGIGEVALDIGTVGLATIETVRAIHHGHQARKLRRGR